jgi:hypothetical protein
MEEVYARGLGYLKIRKILEETTSSLKGDQK